LIDLHCHLVPAVDDGVESVAQAVEMCRAAAADGVELLVATPHRRRDEWPDLSRAELERRLDEVRRAAGGAVRLELGSELRVDSDLLRDLDRHGAESVIPLGRSRTLLLEFEPRGIGPDPVALVDELIARGYRPLVAHPELTPFLAHDLDLAARLVDRGALLQVTTQSVTGELGRVPRERTAQLFERSLVAVLASDAHRHDWRPAGLSRARREIERRWGADTALAVTSTNPAALVAGGPTVAPRLEASA
jgi:protein-tyrosine phosphatase